MATRFYFRSIIINNGAVDTPQSNLHPSLTPTSGKAWEDFTVTRQLDFTKGVSAVTKAITSNPTTSLQTFYYGRWMSPRLNLSGGISANTWTCALGGFSENASGNFPVSGSNKTVQIFVYVWREGTGLVGTIKQGLSNANWSEPTAASNRTYGGTFAGNAVGSLQDGDRIVYEMWYEITQSASGEYDDHFYYEGPTDVSATNNTSLGDGTSTATWLETPQTITEWTPPENITMSVTSKDLRSKFITAV